MHNNEDLEIIERDITNKFPKKDSFAAKEVENLNEIFWLNARDCDKKIYPIEELLISLESKHINDLLERFLQENNERKRKHQENGGTTEVADDQHQEDDYDDILNSDQEGNTLKGDPKGAAFTQLFFLNR